MWSSHKRKSEAQLGHNKRDIPAFDTVLFHSNVSSLRRKYLSDVLTDKILLSCGSKISKKPLNIRYWWLRNKERNFIFSFVGGDFWQPLIAPEAWKERSHQSFSASHIGQRADRLFHRPAFFRPGLHKKIPRCHWLARKQLPMMSLLHYLMLTLLFEISSPCTKNSSRTRLYNTAASKDTKVTRWQSNTTCHLLNRGIDCCTE